MEKSYEQLREERAEVRSRYPDVTFPTPVLQPLWFGRRELEVAEGLNAIVDQNTGRLINVCSDQYKIVHYEDIIGMVEDVVKGIDRYGKILLCPSVLSDGGKMKLTMKFPEAQSVVRSIDNIVPKIDVMSSYDLSYKLMGRFGAYVLRCTNGMGVWQNFKKFARKHLQTLNMSDLGKTILEGLGLFSVQIESWRQWADQIIDLESYNGVWEQLPFSSAEKERIEILPETSTGLIIRDALKSKELTVWNFNSVLTQFATHEIKSDLRRIDIEPEIAKTMERLFVSVTA